MPRRLNPDEREIWGRVTATTKPIDPGRHKAVGLNVQDPTILGMNLTLRRVSTMPKAERTPLKMRGLNPANTLDGGWDRRIAKGSLTPDFTIDLHGETLASAHARLDRSLSFAIHSDARIVLLITGKSARENPRLPPSSRGVIRASVRDWLSASSHARHIAAIRSAHPRHGGAGALYLILRRG
jgi:DNA-nicking Smr family endonuclease